MALKNRRSHQNAMVSETGRTTTQLDQDTTMTLLQQTWFHLSLVLDAILVSILSIPAICAQFFYLVFPRPCKNVKGDIVLVTGSGQGLGRQLALLFAAQGCEVVCVDIMDTENEETAQQVRALGAKARAYVCNVADRTAVMKLAEKVGQVDILVNNAGIIPFNNFWTMTEEQIRNLTDINYLSHFWTIQAFVPAMKERNQGHVVCVSSMSALVGWAHASPYASTKFAIRGMMKSLSLEMRQEKKSVKITTVFPYFIRTRPELEQCIKTRIPHLNLKEAAEDIILGIRQNLTSFTVPRSLNAVAIMFSIFPESLEDRWYEKCFVKITDQDYKSEAKQTRKS